MGELPSTHSAICHAETLWSSELSRTHWRQCLHDGATPRCVCLAQPNGLGLIRQLTDKGLGPLIYRTQLGQCQRHTFTVFVLATVGHVPLRNGCRELVGGVFPTLRGQTPAGDRPQLATIG